MRLLLLQTAVHGTRHGCMSNFARDLGISVKRLENVLAGRTELSGQMTDIIRNTYGISAEWLRYGNMDALGDYWRPKIQEAQRRLDREKKIKKGGI